MVGIAGGSLTLIYLIMLAISYEVCFNNLYGPYAVTAVRAAKLIAIEFGSFLGILGAFLVTFGQTRRTWLWGQTNKGLTQEEFERR